MRIASLVIRVRPEHIEALGASLRAIPGVEVHAASAELGRMIVTVEDGESWSMADSVLAVNLARHVLGVTLAYEYTDEGLAIEMGDPLPGHMPAAPQAATGQGA